nr:reverse transcriptase domain-containing protein [Tanacetum cinerariifolium]
NDSEEESDWDDYERSGEKTLLIQEKLAQNQQDFLDEYLSQWDDDLGTQKHESELEWENPFAAKRDPGLWSEVISRWESITINRLNNQTWSDNKAELAFVENLLEESEKLMWQQWRTVFPEAYSTLEEITDEPQNITSQVRIVLKCAKITKNRTISTQDQKPQRKARSRSKFSVNNLTMKLNLSKVKSRDYYCPKIKAKTIKRQKSKSRDQICKLLKVTRETETATLSKIKVKKGILKQFQATPPPASVKAVEEMCVTCGGAHPYYQCLAAGGNTFLELRDNIQGYISAAAVSYNQGNSVYRPSGSGSLPSNTIDNAKGELKSITTRSGIVLDGPSVPPPLVQKSKPPSQRSYVVHQRDLLHPNIPYPLRMLKQKQQEKDEVQIHKFWQMFKQLHINITLADTLILIPKYQKMLKALLSNKEKLLELTNTPLNENCSVVILKKLHEKIRDPGKFLIPCGFNELKCKALADL